jgi:hypothetical protein
MRYRELIILLDAALRYGYSGSMNYELKRNDGWQVGGAESTGGTPVQLEGRRTLRYATERHYGMLARWLWGHCGGSAVSKAMARRGEP